MTTVPQANSRKGKEVLRHVNMRSRFRYDITLITNNSSSSCSDGVSSSQGWGERCVGVVAEVITPTAAGSPLGSVCLPSGGLWGEVELR